MSWKMIHEVRQARLAGQLPDINFPEFAVLFIMADSCRIDSREASLSMAELMKLSGQARASMSRAVNKLVRLGYLGEPRRGNQHTASSYQILPHACISDATSTEDQACITTATSTPDACNASDTSTTGVHVSLAHEHVSLASSARIASDTYPESPSSNPEEGSRFSGTSPGRPAANPTVRTLRQSANSKGKRLRCDRHAHIAEDSDVPPCLACKRIREEADAMAETERTRQAAERARRAAEYERIQSCPDCHGGHWVLDHDGMPLDPAVRCQHPNLAREEL